MLTYIGEAMLSFAEAQPGDEFYQVRFARFTSNPVSVVAYKVLRVGKRDVIIAAISDGIELRIGRHAALPHAYLTNEEVAWARADIRLRNKRDKAWQAIHSSRTELIPEDLADQIIAWEASLASKEDAKKDNAE